MVRIGSKRRFEDLSSSPSTREVDDIPISAEQENTVASPLSKLRPLKKPPNGSTTSTKLSENAREKYAAAVQLVKEALATDLTSGEHQDVVSLVDVANMALSSLDGLRADYKDLYKAVENFIAGNIRVSVMESEIEDEKALVRNSSLINDLSANVEYVVKEQKIIESTLRDATRESDRLRRRIQKKKSLLDKMEHELKTEEICFKEKKTGLEKLEQELKTKEICIKEGKTKLGELKYELLSNEIRIKGLQQEWADAGASRAYLMAEKDRMAREAEAASSVLADVYRRRDEAEVELEIAKYGLLSCLG